MKKEMYALVKETAAPGLTLKKIPVPKMGVGDVLIKIRKTAICGTDMHIFNWDGWSSRTIRPPMTPGHEFVGEIAAMDKYARGFDIGDIVSGEGHIVCKTCRNCMAGRRHLCKNTVGVGVNCDGAFAEYLCLPYENAVKVSKDIPEDVAACFDPLGNAVHTALKFDVAGEDVLITGAGPIGIMAAIIVRHCGCKHIVITDVNDARLELAKKAAPDCYTLNATRDTLNKAIKDLDMKEGFDVGLEMSGNQSAFADMVDYMNSGGKIALLGLHSERTVINWDHVVFNGLTIQGIYGREMFETWYKMMSMLQTGLDIAPVITHRLDARDYEQGFAAMNSGKSGKVILDWSKIGEEA
ncbi:MAG: L-threonine 3-dehydrogenase [Clostridiales Family XIII bacterium]|jgi:threonine 3-dehydrogenase|nr:L-threonine 3-dehydrogenase [Clostridiales Family XIII bacterium]